MRVPRTILLGSLGASLVCLLLHARGAKNLAAEKSMGSKIDALFSSLTDAASPGAAVLVRKDGRAILEQGYGIRDLRTLGKIDSQTNFRLASCSKQFTAMAVMLLVHNGTLRYEDKLTDVFPDFPPYGKTITIRNLLNHTSGLRDYEDLMDQSPRSRWSERRQIQDAEVLNLLKQQSATKFSPGTKWAYSNSGYVVLGLVVAQVSGQPLAQFLHERIFGPLQMNHTVAYQRGQNEISNRAYGHTQQGTAWKETDQSSTSATLGDGGIYSSLDDLAKWDQALGHHALLGETEMQPALTPVPLADGSQPQWPAGSDRPEGTPVSYGFGWFVDPYQGRARMWHYGETVGFHTYIQRFLEDQLTIIVLCNRTDLHPEQLAARVADLYLARRR